MHYIAWNVTNWVTVLLMAVLGYMILGLAAQVYKAQKAA